MEGSRRDEEDRVVRHRPVFGGDRGAFDQRQEVALDALAADRAAAHVRDGDLVDLVEEDDAIGFRVLERGAVDVVGVEPRSEEHTSELQSLMRISYAVFCLKKKKTTNIT